MTRISVELTSAEQAMVSSERYSHPDLHVRRKMLVLWSVHTGLTRLQAGEVAGVGRATVQRYLAAYRDGGLDGLGRPHVRLTRAREGYEGAPLSVLPRARERDCQKRNVAVCHTYRASGRGRIGRRSPPEAPAGEAALAPARTIGMLQMHTPAAFGSSASRSLVLCD
jgi:hypothetical protein